MPTPASRRHAHALLMVVVMTFAALAPMVSSLLASAQGRSYTLVEACTTQGLRTFAVAADGSVFDEAPADPSKAFEHCQFCSLAGAGAPPPATANTILPALAARYVAPLFLQAPRTLAIWLAAPARGPPALV